MSWRQRFRKLFAPPNEERFSRRSYWVRVRCQRCGEILSARVDLQNDLSFDYGSQEYRVHKVIVGSGENRCFQRIEVQMRFDKQKRLVDIDVHGGEEVKTPIA